ncbi:hypothetical protein D3C81_1015900 [compost metagenome]
MESPVGLTRLPDHWVSVSTWLVTVVLSLVITACQRTGWLVCRRIKSLDCTLSVVLPPAPTLVPCVALPVALTFSVLPPSSPPPQAARTPASMTQAARFPILFMDFPKNCFDFSTSWTPGIPMLECAAAGILTPHVRFMSFTTHPSEGGLPASFQRKPLPPIPIDGAARPRQGCASLLAQTRVQPVKQCVKLASAGRAAMAQVVMVQQRRTGRVIHRFSYLFEYLSDGRASMAQRPRHAGAPDSRPAPFPPDCLTSSGRTGPGSSP